MIDLKRLIDLFSEKLGRYNTYPHIYRKNPERIAMHLFEEAGEISRAFRKHLWSVSRDEAASLGYGMPKPEHLLEEELADTIILAGLLASSLDIDLDKAVKEKLHKNFLEGKVLLDVDQILIPTKRTPVDCGFCGRFSLGKDDVIWVYDFERNVSNPLCSNCRANPVIVGSSTSSEHRGEFDE